LSVGLENVNDLKADISQALKQTANTTKKPKENNNLIKDNKISKIQ